MTSDIRQRVADAIAQKWSELHEDGVGLKLGIVECLADAAIAAMSEWNTDMTAAPRDGSPVFIDFGSSVCVAFYAPKAERKQPELPNEQYPWGIIDPEVCLNAFMESSAKAWIPVPLPLPPHPEGE